MKKPLLHISIFWISILFLAICSGILPNTVQPNKLAVSENIIKTQSPQEKNPLKTEKLETVASTNSTKWNEYIDQKNGVHFKFPNELCWSLDDPKNCEIGQKIFWERDEKGDIFGIHNTSNYKNDPFYDPESSMRIIWVKDENEMQKNVKNLFGSNCIIKWKKHLGNNIFEINLEGGGMDDSDCILNFMSEIRYYPDYKKLVVWKIWQDCQRTRDDFKNPITTCYQKQVLDTLSFFESDKV